MNKTLTSKSHIKGNIHGEKIELETNEVAVFVKNLRKSACCCCRCCCSCWFCKFCLCCEIVLNTTFKSF